MAGKNPPLTDAPIPLYKILEEEYEHLNGPLPGDYPDRYMPSPDANGKDSDRRLKAFYNFIQSRDRKRTALCLSGGGIRSATFSLGVIQSLARLGLLDTFDYVSTVSGGGYIGSWLMAWIYRHPRGIQGVIEELSQNPESKPGEEPDQIRWLRRYGRYLSPRMGLFSSEMWGMYLIYTRNVWWNGLALWPLLCLIMMVPRYFISLVGTNEILSLWPTLGVGIGMSVSALTYVHLLRPSLKGFRRNPAWSRLEGEGWALIGCSVPFLLGAVCLAAAFAQFINTGGHLDHLTLWEFDSRGSFMLVGILVYVGSWLLAATVLGRFKSFSRWLLVEMLVNIATGALGGLFVWAVLAELPSAVSVGEYAEWYTFAVIPAFLYIFLVTAWAFIGIANDPNDYDSEWWGTAGTGILIASIAWIIVSWLVVFQAGFMSYTPEVFNWAVLICLGLLIWKFFGRTKRISQEQPTLIQRVLALATKAAAPYYIAFTLFNSVLLTDWILKGLAELAGMEVLSYSAIGLRMPPDVGGHAIILHNTPLWLLLELTLIMVLMIIVASVGMAWFLNINQTSLHGMYRNRLVRAYLGASRPKNVRADSLNPSTTSFNPDDDLPIANLASFEKSLRRPLLIINIALNLVKSVNLAWQQRKAQSFTVSPLHSGSWNLGYRRSIDYGVNPWTNQSISLGTALTISGSALSPNMGYLSSPAVTFLLTLLNIRLGWWLGNPGTLGKETYRRSSPVFSLGPLLSEAFGLTNAEGPYVYLSDGGHFENLGLYEMVLRRCHYILLVDAGSDPDLSYEDLGNAIRKIRIDMGIEIEIDLEPLKRQHGSKFSRWHHAFGTIHYEKLTPSASAGILIYLKPSLTGDEPVDVLEYATAQRLFPNESTANQFFGESQFESYRRLGEHIGWEVFQAARSKATDGFSAVITEMRSQLTVLSEVSESCSPRLMD